MSIKLRINVNDEIGLYDAFILALSTKFNITDGERKVLSVLMFLNNEHRGANREDRYSLLFSTKYRKEIAELSGISKQVLENRLSSLRRKRVIEDNMLNPTWDRTVNDGDSVSYIFSLKEKDNG